MAGKIDAGTITVNDHMFSFVEPGAIWGGIKQSGIGRSHGSFGLRELVNIKLIFSDFSRKKKQLWWYPYDFLWEKILKKAIIFFYHEHMKDRFKALFSLFSSLPKIMKESPFQNYIKSIPRFFRK